MKITVGLVDDHQLFLKSLSIMLDSFHHYEVIVEVLNGAELQKKLSASGRIPSIMLIDVNMPVMNGMETAAWLQKKYPAMRLVALSMNDTDKAILKMIKAGCCAYLLKDMHPNELETALDEINSKGFYNADASNINYRRLLMAQNEEQEFQLTDREKAFLPLACSELTYKQIAVEMKVSERIVDGYRENLFQKFKVQSRVGLCLEAIRREVISL